MVGENSAYRVRVGDYRVVYEIHDRILLIQVVRIGHRRNVYG
jgi:mRNA interferase RelE/StbE